MWIFFLSVLKVNIRHGQAKLGAISGITEARVCQDVVSRSGTLSHLSPLSTKLWDAVRTV